jgi:hypothetical protein
MCTRTPTTASCDFLPIGNDVEGESEPLFPYTLWLFTHKINKEKGITLLE